MRESVPWEDLVRAIQDAPEDDGPRLVCADWLSARGEPRGEHVMLQVARASLRRDDPAITALDARLSQISPEPWLSPLHKLGARGPHSGRQHRNLELTRGFVEQVTLVGQDVANAGAVLRLEPVTSLVLVSPGPRASALAADCPELARVRALILDGRHHEGHELIVASKHLVQLDSLTIPHSDATVGALAHGVLRPRKLSCLGLDEAVIAKLVRSAFFERADHLFIGHYGLLDAAVVALAQAPLLSLTSLSLSDSKVGAAGLDALGPRLGNLVSLSLGRTNVGHAGVEVLTKHATGALRRLELTGIEDATLVDAILRSPYVASLRSLDLRYARFSSSALDACLERSGMNAKQVQRAPSEDW